MGVLIVDDTLFMRTTIANMLKENNIEVVGEASNGVEAIRFYKSLSPDLVTMDITMPEMGGIEAIREIIKEDPDAKIIVCSAMGYEDIVIEAVEAGAKGFIVKPIEQERLIEEVKKVLGIEEEDISSEAAVSVKKEAEVSEDKVESGEEKNNKEESLQSEEEQTIDNIEKLATEEIEETKETALENKEERKKLKEEIKSELKEEMMKTVH